MKRYLIIFSLTLALLINPFVEIFSQGLIIFLKDGTTMTFPNEAIDSVVAYSSSDHEIKFSSNSLQFSPASSSQFLKLNSDTRWDATTSDNWIILSTNSGTKSLDINVTVTKNLEQTDRKGYVAFNFFGKEDTIDIVQQGCYLSANPTKISFSSSGGNQSVSIISNSEYTLSTTADWLEIPQKGTRDDVISIIAAENTSLSGRKASVIIKVDNGLECCLNVSQESQSFVFPQDTLKYGCEETTDTIVCNSKLKVSVSCSEDWLNVKYENGKLIIFVQDNELGKSRKADVKLSISDGEDSIEKAFIVRQNPIKTLIDKDAFGEDSNLNNPNSGSEINKEDFEEDDNLNTNDSGSTIDKQSFDDDIAL